MGRKKTKRIVLMQESEHSRGSTMLHTIMESPAPQKNQPTSIESLRFAFVRVLKRRRVHNDFLRVSKETEERLSEDRPSTMFFYGL